MSQEIKLHASQDDIEEIKSFSREKLESYAIIMLDQYLYQKHLTNLEKKKVESLTRWFNNKEE
jgi:hypothetical protein|tara:strand:- start:1083 stop:1271 length:189 start_codon:yes stop_codon:yes gene_type:complete